MQPNLGKLKPTVYIESVPELVSERRRATSGEVGESSSRPVEVDPARAEDAPYPTLLGRAA